MYSSKDLKFKVFSITLFLLFIFIGQKLISQEISTIGEIYDFEVGDEFHLKESVSSSNEFSGDYGHYSHTNFQVLDKYFSDDNDTIYYSMEIKNVFASSAYPEEVYSDYIENVSYTDLNSLINSGEIDTVYTNPPEYNGRVINFKHNGGSYHFWEWKYVKGCGQAFYEYYDWDPEEFYNITITLAYYKKGEEEWGTPNIIVSAEEDEVIQENMKVYPNPTKDYIIIQNTNIGSGKLEIHSLTCRTIKRIIFSNNQKVNISELKPGIYILKIEQNGQQTFKKLIKE